MQLSRSIPYFNALLKAQNNKRMSILKAFPTFVIDDLIEILYNIVLGKANIGTRKNNLIKHQNALLKLIDTKTKNGRRRVIYNQNGGFLNVLIPIIAAIASKML